MLTQAWHGSRYGRWLTVPNYELRASVHNVLRIGCSVFRIACPGTPPTALAPRVWPAPSLHRPRCPKRCCPPRIRIRASAARASPGRCPRLARVSQAHTRPEVHWTMTRRATAGGRRAQSLAWRGAYAARCTYRVGHSVWRWVGYSAWRWSCWRPCLLS